MIRYCDCPDWEPNCNHINSSIVLSSIHNVMYDLTPFLYCPWCGKKLKEKEIDEQRAQ